VSGHQRSGSDLARWPAWVYGGGHEPDPRFTFANERTFLAWIRTSLALLAAGVAVEAFDLPGDRTVHHLLSVTLVLLGMACALASWWHWARAERALRHGRPLPGTPLAPVVALGLVACTLLLLIGLW
jgi:putative membrane protein